jgi:maleylacetate reductase
VAAFNAPASREAMRRVARALGVEDASTGLHALNRRLGLHATLGSLGFRTGDVERAASLVTSGAYTNPRPVTSDDVQAILRAAL